MLFQHVPSSLSEDTATNVVSFKQKKKKKEKRIALINGKISILSHLEVYQTDPDTFINQLIQVNQPVVHLSSKLTAQ